MKKKIFAALTAGLIAFGSFNLVDAAAQQSNMPEHSQRKIFFRLKVKQLTAITHTFFIKFLSRQKNYH